MNMCLAVLEVLLTLADGVKLTDAFFKLPVANTPRSRS